MGWQASVRCLEEHEPQKHASRSSGNSNPANYAAEFPTAARGVELVSFPPPNNTVLNLIQETTGIPRLSAQCRPSLMESRRHCFCCRRKPSTHFMKSPNPKQLPKSNPRTQACRSTRVYPKKGRKHDLGRNGASGSQKDADELELRVKTVKNEHGSGSTWAGCEG